MRGRINYATESWLNHPSHFRLLQRHTHSLIIGSVPLFTLLLPNVHWTPESLTVSTPNGWSFTNVVEHLQEHEGYIQDLLASETFTASSSPVTRLTTLRRVRHVDGDERRSSIIVLESANDRAEHVVVHLQSTCLMCYISHDRLFSLYPIWTLNGTALAHPAVSYHLSGSRILRWFRKYRRRGYRIYGCLDDSPLPCDDACPMLWRNTKDVAVLYIHFGIDDIEWNLPEDHEDYSWCLNTDTQMPMSYCRNIFCTRSPPMLPRRNGRRPETPFYNGYVPSSAATFSDQFFTVEPSLQS